MNVDSKPFANESSLIAGRRISFVGRLGGINRKEARTLVREQGGVMVDKLDPSVDLIVVGADQPLDEVDELLEDWISESVAEGRLGIINETQLWQELGLVDEDLDACRLYTPAMLARLLDVPISSIRRWHRRGLIRPLRKSIDFRTLIFRKSHPLGASRAGLLPELRRSQSNQSFPT